eukprot:NODE_1098_length_2217_cov_0.429178.p1 type:complete len:253 gc:universal NODE_1098_length_2217_cov_0.429178:1907-1149(-)
MSKDWDSQAYTYDYNFTHHTTLYASDAIEIHPPTGKTLDIACGTGALAKSIINANLECDLLAIDYSQTMVDIYKQRYPFKCMVMDGMTLDGLMDHEFDTIYSMFGLFLFDNRLNGYSSAYRVLKPGGYLITTSWATTTMKSMSGLMKMIFSEMPRDLQSNFVDLGIKDNFIKDVEQAGFKDTQIYESWHSIVFKNHEALWQFFKQTSPNLTIPLSKMSESDLNALKLKVFEYVGDQTPIILPNCAHILVTRK